MRLAIKAVFERFSAKENATVSTDGQVMDPFGEKYGGSVDNLAANILDLVKNQTLKTPRFTTPGPVTRHLDAKGYEATTGIGPDLMTAAKDAVSGMIDLLQAQQGISAVDAYMLCSVCGDLRISEIVDMPNWVVSFYFPRVVFE